MLILFNVNINSSHLHLKDMKIIIFLILSIGCHLAWLLYHPLAFLQMQFNQTQPAQRIAVKIITSQPYAPQQVARKPKPIIESQDTPSTQFNAKKVRMKAESNQPHVTKLAPVTEPKPKPLPKEPEITKRAKVSDQVTKVAPEQQQVVKPAPASSAPVIAAQHSLKNQIVEVQTLPLFKAPRPALNYPLRAKRRGYQGVTILQIELDEHGLITNLRVLKSSGFTELDKAALSNASLWQFHPVMRDNHNVKARFSVPIEFSLRS
ncbi:hypothetical protein CWB85_08780 [Pseudoalteromonas sp. S1727]|nr:hypothetical protein CWB85_08780 [Pseudoalteromonas sp. S1727]